MADVGVVAITEDVGGPFVFRGVGVAGTDVSGLQGLEVLESAQFIGHFRSQRMSGWSWSWRWMVVGRERSEMLHEKTRSRDGI